MSWESTNSASNLPTVPMVGLGPSCSHGRDEKHPSVVPIEGIAGLLDMQLDIVFILCIFLNIFAYLLLSKLLNCKTLITLGNY